MMACLVTGCFEGQMFQTIITQINGRKIPQKAPEQQIQSLVEEVQSWEDTLGKYYCILVLLSLGIPAAAGERSRLEGSLT